MDDNGLNKYGQYRKIRQDRTYRPLGKMSLWRMLLGLALLVLVLLISGVPAQRVAAGGHYRAARALTVAPGWMERYKPQALACIRAGVMVDSGDWDGAFEALSQLDPEALTLRDGRIYLRLCQDLAGHYEQEDAERCAAVWTWIARLQGEG